MQHHKLRLIHQNDPTQALNQALAAHDDGDVPLLVDPRAPVAPELAASRMPAGADWAVLTSGTTGAPKIVVRTHASWQAACDPLNTELGLAPGDGLWLPVHQVSSMALFSAVWARHSGLTLMIPTKDDPGLTRAAVGHVTPRWLETLVQYLAAGVETTLHTVLVGGDRIPAHLVARARQFGLRVVPYCGASELSFVAWDTDGTGLRAFPGVDTVIVDDLLWVASPQIALDVVGGTLHTRMVDGTRWATVGDRARKTVDGVLTLLGRADGAIMTAGATVIPAHVEAVLNEHPEVTASLVLGQPDAVLGQRVTAWIETTTITLAELRTWARERLPAAARPVQWYRVDQLPRTASGKIRRVAPEEP